MFTSCPCCQNPTFNDSHRVHLRRFGFCFPLASASGLTASSLPKALLHSGFTTAQTSPFSIQRSFALKKVCFCIAPPSRTEPHPFAELTTQSRPLSYPEIFFLRLLNVRLLARFSSDPNQYRRLETRSRHPGPPTPSIHLNLLRGFRRTKIDRTDETHLKLQLS